MSNQHQSEIEQEHGKPGEDPVTLPPIIPGYEICSDSSNAELKRLVNLVFQGYSTVIYAQENRLPPENRHILWVAFQGECQAVLALVNNTAQFCKSFSAQDRLDLFKDYESLCQELETLVKRYLVNNKAIPSGKIPLKFIDLNFSLCRLFQREGIMSSIEADIFARALAKWAKEYQETQKKDKKLTETISDSKKTAQNIEGELKMAHSIDFRSVCWFGANYSFTPNQAAAVKILWEAWENRTPDVGGDTLAVEVEADSRRARDIFKGHTAFGSMIRQGQTKGTYRLVEPDK